MKRYVVLPLLLALSGCITYSYSLLSSDPSWKEIKDPPSDEASLLSAAENRIKDQYSSSKYDHILFAKSEDAYLIYFRDHYWMGYSDYSRSHCGDETVVFRKINGNWTQTKEGKFVVCVD